MVFFLETTKTSTWRAPCFWSNIDQLRAFTERDVKWSEIKDFTGKVIDPEKTGNGDITLYLERFEDDGKKRSSVDHDERQSLKK